jgi:phi13 family phage major tail protein
MATIGLDRLYYAKITEDDNGDETYDTPMPLAKAISAELSVELAEATLYADDGAAEIVKEFKSGTLTLGIDDIGVAAAGDLTGATIDDNHVLISTSEDGGAPVAIGFRAQKANGKYRYFWLYRVKFGIPATNLATKGDSITFSTPTIEGTVLRRNKLDGQGKHPWKAEVNEGDEGVTSTVINSWFNEVYEPTFAASSGIGE